MHNEMKNKVILEVCTISDKNAGNKAGLFRPLISGPHPMRFLMLLLGLVWLSGAVTPVRAATISWTFNTTCVTAPANTCPMTPAPFASAMISQYTLGTNTGNQVQVQLNFDPAYKSPQGGLGNYLLAFNLATGTPALTGFSSTFAANTITFLTGSSSTSMSALATNVMPSGTVTGVPGVTSYGTFGYGLLCENGSPKGNCNNGGFGGGNAGPLLFVITSTTQITPATLNTSNASGFFATTFLLNNGTAIGNVGARTSTPEPGGIALLGFAAAGFLAARWRKIRAHAIRYRMRPPGGLSLTGMVVAATLLAPPLSVAGQTEVSATPPRNNSGSIPIPDARMDPAPLYTPSTGHKFYRAGDAAWEGSDGLVAIVEGFNVRVEDIADAIAALPSEVRQIEMARLYPIVLERLVNRAVILSEAYNNGLDNDATVKRRMRLAANTALETAFLDRAAAGQITEAAIVARYKARFGNEEGIPEVRLRVIMHRTVDEAWATLAALKAGEDFIALAHARGIDPAGAHGGDIGFVRGERFNTLQRQTVELLSPGEHAAVPVPDRLGWSVVRLEERRMVPVPTLSQARDALDQELRNEFAEKMLASLRERHRIRRFNLDGSPLTLEQMEAAYNGQGIYQEKQ